MLQKIRSIKSVRSITDLKVMHELGDKIEISFNLEADTLKIRKLLDEIARTTAETSDGEVTITAGRPVPKPPKPKKKSIVS